MYLQFCEFQIWLSFRLCDFFYRNAFWRARALVRVTNIYAFAMEGWKMQLPLHLFFLIFLFSRLNASYKVSLSHRTLCVCDNRSWSHRSDAPEYLNWIPISWELIRFKYSSLFCLWTIYASIFCVCLLYSFWSILSFGKFTWNFADTLWDEILRSNYQLFSLDDKCLRVCVCLLSRWFVFVSQFFVILFVSSCL